MGRALIVLCALLCVFVLSARSELNVPWPPSNPPDCSSTTWDFEGEAYAFCHMDFTGSHTDNEWDGETVSEVIEPCNFHYFKIDAATYEGGLEVGDWLEVRLDYFTNNGSTSSLNLLGRWEDLPTEEDNDFVFSASPTGNVSFSISPYYVSYYSTIWLAVGAFNRNDDFTDPADYTLSVNRYRPSQECGDCICDTTFGNSEIPLSTTNADSHIVTRGSFVSEFNDTRPFLSDADPVYQRMRNFHFNVDSSLYRPGAYLDINITVYDGSSALNNAFLSKGPYAVDPYTSDSTGTHAVNLFHDDTGNLGTEPCVNGGEVAGQTNHLIRAPCDFYYGDYYLTLFYESSGCVDGATFEIIVTVYAPIVNQLSVNTQITNNLQDNIFLGGQASYSQFDHYSLAVTGTTGRTHAFARLTSVYGAQLGLFMRTSDQTDNNIVFGNHDRTLVPYLFNYGDEACSDCYETPYSCQTLAGEEAGSCGCYFIVPSCDFSDNTYYLSVVPGTHDGNYYVDGNSYHLEVNLYEDSLSVALAPGEPVVASLAVWTPFQAYTFATPNAVDTWAVVELFVRAPSSDSNQLGQPSLTLSLQQGYTPYDVCTGEEDYYKICTTESFFTGYVDDGYGLSPTACNIFVDTCRLNSGPIYLVVYNDDEPNDIAPFGVTGGHWDYVLWADLENPWALEADVTYTDRIHGNFYNHYYIDVDDSIEAGSWLSVDFENIYWLDEATSISFTAFLNYESLAGECPCYEYVDVCQVGSSSPDESSCEAGDDCPTDVNGWNNDYGFDLPDNTYPVWSEINNFNSASCRVQATACSFRPGRWYVSTKATGCKSEPAQEGDNLIGYTVTAHIHDAPVVNELEFNTQITEQLEGSEIRHYQLTNVDATGDDLVITVAWYEEVLSRFYTAYTLYTYTEPKAYTEDWGLEVRLNFGDLAFEECYEHPWSCKASFKNGGSCQIIVPVCKWAQVDPEQIFVSVRYDRGLNDTEDSIYQSMLTGYGVDPVDVLASEFWVGAAQFNLLVSSERAEVTALAVGTPVYGSVKKDRYAHYSLQLLQTQGLRTDIDIYYNVQTAYDWSFEGDEAYFPILALNEGSLAGDGRGCRDCFTTARTCQNDAACHWTFDSCDALDIDTTYYLSVYKPANAFYDQALEFALSVSQEDLVIPVDLTSDGRLTSTIKLQDSYITRAFFELDGSSLQPRQSPYDALYITVWANGAYDSSFTAYLNHDGLAGACPCYGRICQQDLNLTTECPIAYHSDSDTDYRGALVDYNLEAGAYFLTFEFPGVVGSDAVVLTIEANAVYYPVFQITPTNLRESGPEFWLGDFDLPYGELLGDDDSDPDFDYNAGYNMDHWLIDSAGNIDWDHNNVFRNHVLNPANFVQRYRITPPSRLDALNWQNLNFYAVQITSRNDVPGFPMPDRVYVGIDNIQTDHDNCQTAHGLYLNWYGTDDRAVNPFLTSTVLDDTRTTCSRDWELDNIFETFIARTGNGLLFTELPPCLFTHAGTAVHYFGVESHRFQGWDLELSDYDEYLLRGSYYYDIRFWIQKPIVLENIASFYTGTDFDTETVDPPFSTNWQPFRYNSYVLNDADFKQRFELDLSAEIAGMAAPFVQVVIEHEFDELTVTVNGDYAPNFYHDDCYDSCSLRSVLEVRQGSLSAVQLQNTAIVADLNGGSSYLATNAANSQQFITPDDSHLHYTLSANQTFVFTLDPCALAQSSDWFFDIKSTGSNASFWVYYTDPVDLLAANVVDITVSDVELRDWVPNTIAASLDGLDDYTFLRLNVDDLDLFASGLGRPRLEIQIDWLPQFDTDQFSGALDQAAAIVISRDAPLFLKGESQGAWPFELPGTNFAELTNDLQSDFDLLSYDSHIEVCTAAFYLSTVGPTYNATNDAARNSGRFFLDGCDLAGTSEIWITARMLTAGYRDFQVLARVVADKIGTTGLGISDGYPTTAQVSIQSDSVDAIQPHSFNHHSFALPADLQTDSSVQSTLIVELKFPDDDIDRYNGTYFLLFSADAPAGFSGSRTPDNYVSETDGRYSSPVIYAGLNTFGQQSSFDSAGSATYDCFTNFIDYKASSLTFDVDDTGIVPVGNFITEYRTRRNIDLFQFRYASTLWVSVYFAAPVWEELDPQEESDELGWQGYELRVWLQDEPATTPIQIQRNISGNTICWDVSTDTGVDANTFDYNITWGPDSLTPTWFAFEVTEDLVSLDCSNLETDECLFSQWLEFQIFNDWLTFDGFVQDSTFGSTGYPEIYIQNNWTVYGPARFSVGGSGDMYTSSVGHDIVAGEWTIHDSHLSSDLRLSNFLELVAVNQSSSVSQFFPCSGFNDQGQGYGVDTDWIFNSEFYAHTAIMSLRPGTYYIPVWSADSVDFTICASLNSFGYDTLWTNPASPYIPREIDIDVNAGSDEAVAVLAQVLGVPSVNVLGTTYEYYWFHLDDSQFDARDYLQVWLDQVLICDNSSICTPLADDTTIILQMFRSDCQLWTCQADGEGAGCEGRYTIGAQDLDNVDFYFDSVSRFVLGGAGLSPCSLTSGDFFIKVSLPGQATYSLSVYLRTPPATLALPDAVAIRSTIFQSAFQHYSYSAADTASALLTSLEVSLTEVACGSLELFAKHGTPAGPFYPTTLDRTTFIGSQMYNPTYLGGSGLLGFYSQTRFIGSSLEKCSSAYCATSSEDNTCSIHLGTTELSKDLDSAGSLGSTTWFFAVRVVDSTYTTDNDEADVFTSAPVSTIYGDGFFEPVTYFITAEAHYTEVTQYVQWGCSVSLEDAEAECGAAVVPDPNSQATQFGFQTVGLFTDAYVRVSGEGSFTYQLNATVEGHEKPDGVNQYVEPVWYDDSWAWVHFVSNSRAVSTNLIFDSSVVDAGPKNFFVTADGASTLSADFYHYPVPLIAPGVVYSGAGRDTYDYIGNRFINSHYVIYEFSPSLTSAPLFSLTHNADDDVYDCFDPQFWYEYSCGSYYPDYPDTSDLFDACGDFPRFLSFRLGDCSPSCSSLSCDDVFRWELGYQTSLPITELLLNVESCGADWEAVQFVEPLIDDDAEYVIFSLPVDVDPSTATEASWLALDFYPSLENELSDVELYLFESSALDCYDDIHSARENFFDQQNAFFCPSNAYMVVPTSSFLLDYSASSITASNFKISVVDAGSLSTAVPGDVLSFTATFSDFTQYDLFNSFAVYSFTIPDSLVASVSHLTVDVQETDGCLSVENWWVNFGSPVPVGCADVLNSDDDELEACEVLPGTYFISLQLNPSYSDEAYPEFSVTITVSLDVFDVLAVPETGDFSATFTIEPYQTIVLQTALSQAWLSAHPALQNEILYRITSPLGTITLDGFDGDVQEACFDCLAPVFSTEFTSPFETPFDIVVQFELMSDLLLDFDASVVSFSFPWGYAYNFDVSNVQLPLQFLSSYQGILAPYFDQRSLTINTLSLGTPVSGTLYNAFTYRQLQVYTVSTVAADAIGQIRVSDVTGGIVSLQVFPASLVADFACGEFKECHSAPIQWSDGHGLLQANPLNNIAGSCSLVYSPCEWASYPTYFVVIHDHVFNDVETEGGLYTSPFSSPYDDDFSVGYSNDNSTNFEYDSFGCYGYGCHQMTPTQDNPFVATQFTLTATEEFYFTESFPTAAQSFSTRPAPSERSSDNPAGNWQHFFYSYEASGVSSIVISVDVTASSALATSGVYVTVTDSDCGCSSFERNIWCSAEYPSWLCEIEIPTHADHPLTSTTFYIDVYGLKGSFSLDVHEGLDNCVWSDGQDFCPTRVLNYAFWPSVPSDELDDKASCLYNELLSAFEDPACNDCVYDIPDECKIALQEYACAATFNPCDVDGFIDATVCVDKCTAVEDACPYSFVEAGFPNLDCGHPRYSSSNCF